ncbi:ABC transporter ATP-binding protein [Alicyclobacillus fodiniaquatilis]|uniref:ABC transporter ATP-binding protein n=1 Tax=Alicyclobacillus fodiniaquatilis TaxID=1661150 RepID=A0ABW4JGS8_9BACL
MILLENLSKSYEVAGETLTVLKNITLRIADGEFVSVMGPSGSGKSTLMHILGCLDLPTSGSYILDEEDVAKRSRRDLAEVRNTSIGFVFQNFHLLPRMSAVRNVELPMVYAGVRKAERRARARALLEQVGLADRIKHLPNELSGGQKQRVAIARALANQPRLLLADEPTGALDQTTGLEIMALFESLHQAGMTIVVITHDPDVAKQAGRIIRLVDGVIQGEEGGE